jgi:aldehyde dehydrogenase (NAD+)
MAKSSLEVDGLCGQHVLVPAGLFIDNKFVPSVDGTTLDIKNASSRETIGKISSGTSRDVDAAVASSSRAYEQVWRHTSAAERRRLLLKLADLVERDLETFAILEANDVGALMTTTKTILGPMAVEWLRYFAGWADKVEGRSAIWENGQVHGGLSFTRREPYGVTAAIVPWNTPLCVT